MTDKYDTELKAMGKITKALEPLDKDAQHRALAHAVSKFLGAELAAPIQRAALDVTTKGG